MFDRYKKLLEGQEFTGPDMASAAHLRWMCDTVDCENWPLDKASRWLGFVQGVMIMQGLVTVNGERDYSRPLFTAVSAKPPSEWKYRVVEMLAGGLTIIGMAIGSSTQYGNWFYLASQVFWWGLMFSRRMWGLFPLNLAMTSIEVWHYIK